MSSEFFEYKKLMRFFVNRIYHFGYQNESVAQRKKSIAVSLLFLQIAIMILLVLSVKSISAQYRTVLINNGFIVVSSGAYYVIDNNNVNAITVNGGGNIKTEAENNLIKWNIGTNTGIFTVPFTTKNNVKIPMSLEIHTAGVDPGNFLFSTFTDNDAINSWNNQDYSPSVVTNMYGVNGSVNNSSNVIDRFWRIEHNSYPSQVPSSEIYIYYDDNERSAAGNTIPLGTLQAQFYNSNTNKWSYNLSGIDNPGVGVFSIYPDSSFFPFWTLVNFNDPLPVEIFNFKAIEENGNSVFLKWNTASEINNDYFVIEKSKNTINWEVVDTVLGGGTSILTLNYFDYDFTPYIGVSYYRIKQIDFNGSYMFSNIETVEFSKNEEFLVFPNPVSTDENVLIRFNSFNRDVANVKVFDDKGALVLLREFNIDKGENELRIAPPQSFGFYLLKITSDNNTINEAISFIVK